MQHAGHPDVRPDSPLHSNPFEFRYLTEFQSHEPEFDYLKSLEIEEKINKVRWVKGRCSGRTHMLLTTNDKTIKLWKVGMRARGWLSFCSAGRLPHAAHPAAAAILAATGSLLTGGAVSERESLSGCLAASTATWRPQAVPCLFSAAVRCLYSLWRRRFTRRRSRRWRSSTCRMAAAR
jgi:hypothetical protein